MALPADISKDIRQIVICTKEENYKKLTWENEFIPKGKMLFVSSFPKLIQIMTPQRGKRRGWETFCQVQIASRIFQCCFFLIASFVLNILNSSYFGV